MSRRSEAEALAQLQRLKASYQTFIKLNYEQAAKDCRSCPARGSCCTDAHFVNVNITRLEAVAIRETIARTPRLTCEEKREVYSRARETVKRYSLSATGDTFQQTYSCPLFSSKFGCLVHRRAKPAPCIQHACYENWEDLPPLSLQTRTEHRVEKLNIEIYGAAWAWLPLPVWLTLVDPESDGVELKNLEREWSSQELKNKKFSAYNARQLNFKSNARERKVLPVIR